MAEAWSGTIYIQTWYVYVFDAHFSFLYKPFCFFSQNLAEIMYFC